MALAIDFGLRIALKVSAATFRCREAQLKLEEARLVFMDIGDRFAAAQFLKCPGSILWMHEDARLRWRKNFIDNGEQLARCLKSLDNVLRV